MKEFQIGDKVETIDDVVRGEVIDLNNDLVTVKTSDGFKMQFSADELIKTNSVTEIDHDISDKGWPAEKAFEIKREKSSKKIRKVDKSAPMEVDLHIDKLISRPGQMSVNEILIYQLDTARRQLEFALKKRISNMVFIHGVGAGVLKSELQSLFRKYPNLSYRDASFSKYGMGATEVLITYPNKAYS